MILLYHKVFATSPTKWWVSANTFRQQMQALKRFQVVGLTDYDPNNPKHVCITFDGVYENVYRFAFPILKEFGYKFELFVIGNYISKDNSFDTSEPEAKFCTIEQLHIMQSGGGTIQWHTSSHKRLSGLGEAELMHELLVPTELVDSLNEPRNFNWIAYPHGDHDMIAENIVKSNFEGALSVHSGDRGDRFKYPRMEMFENVSFKRPSVSLILANYNYGRFIRDAYDSILNQTTPADEIIIVDDCSTDDSVEIIDSLPVYRNTKIIKNTKNLGIVDNFNNAVRSSSGDYVCIIGADNRIKPDYIEKCRTALDCNPLTGVAYTDIMLFGPEAHKLARSRNATHFAHSKTEGYDYFHWKTTEPTTEAIARLAVHNFIHGSSMYRRRCFDQVGGYVKGNGPEDHNLFFRIISSGWKCERIPFPILEYRQHSPSQANTVLELQRQNQFLGKKLLDITAKYEKLIRSIQDSKTPM